MSLDHELDGAEMEVASRMCTPGWVVELFTAIGNQKDEYLGL